VEETILALRRLQGLGKVRFVGISGLHLSLFREVMEWVKVDQVQSYCHYCLNDTALVDFLAYFQTKGVAVFNSAPLAMRLLSDEGPPDWHPAPPELMEKCAAAAVCRARGMDIGRLALQFAVARLDIPTTIVGTARPERILQNIREIEEPLDSELLELVLEVLRPVHNLSWPSGLPENN